MEEMVEACWFDREPRCFARKNHYFGFDRVLVTFTTELTGEPGIAFT